MKDSLNLRKSALRSRAQHYVALECICTILVTSSSLRTFLLQIRSANSKKIWCLVEVLEVETKGFIELSCLLQMNYLQIVWITFCSSFDKVIADKLYNS